MGNYIILYLLVAVIICFAQQQKIEVYNLLAKSKDIKIRNVAKEEVNRERYYLMLSIVWPYVLISESYNGIKQYIKNKNS